MQRRKILFGAASALVVGVPHEAKAVFPLLGFIGGFVGRAFGSAVGKSVVRAVVRRPVGKRVAGRTNKYIRANGSRYKRQNVVLSTRVGERVGGEFGSYIGEAAGEHISALIRAHKGGAEITVVEAGGTQPPAAVFSTGSRSRSPVTLSGPVFSGVDQISIQFRAQGFGTEAIQGLLYPVNIIANNMNFWSWSATRPTVYSTAFGQVTIQPRLYRGNKSADVIVEDRISRRRFEFEGMPL